MGAPVSGGCREIASPGQPREAPPRTQPPPAGDDTPPPATPHPGTGRRCSPPPAPVTSTTLPSNLSPAAMALRFPALDCPARRPGPPLAGQDKAGRGEGRRHRACVAAAAAAALREAVGGATWAPAAPSRGGQRAGPRGGGRRSLSGAGTAGSLCGHAFTGKAIVKCGDFDRGACPSCCRAGASSQVSWPRPCRADFKVRLPECRHHASVLS